MIIAKIRSLWAGMTRRPQIEAAIADEIEFHIEARTRDLMASGAGPEEAARQARLEFGAPEKYKEEIRMARGLGLLDECWADLKYAARLLRRSPGFTFAAVATLGLGIAANTAVFSVLNEVLLKKLPVRNPDELVQFDTPAFGKDLMVAGFSGSGRRDPALGEGVTTSFPYAAVTRFRDHSQTLSGVFAFSPIVTPLNVNVDNGAETAEGQLVSGTYFQGLGISPELGRPILPIDDNPDASPVVVISDRYWKTRFGARQDAIGKTISINRSPFVVIGVTPEGFYGTSVLQPPDLSLPIAMQPRISPDGRPTGSWKWWLEVMGRRKPGMTRAQVLADLEPLFIEGVRESWDSRPPQLRTPSYESRTVIPRMRVNDGSRGSYLFRYVDFAPMLTLFMAIVALALMIVCANVANLLLARASSRHQELAVRLAIGAGRGRLIRQLITESILLALIGGAVGIGLAYYGRNFMAWLPSARFTLTAEPSLDWRVLAFTAGLSLFTGLLFGVFPGLRATRSDLSPSMRMNANRGGIQRLAMSSSLMVAQVTVCLVLLVGAGLIIQSVHNLLAAQIGFNPQNVVLFDIDSKLGDKDKAKTRRLYETIVEKLEALPGVAQATFSGIRPMTGGGWWETVSSGLDPDSPSDDRVYIQNARRNFPDAMQIPLLIGRHFTEAEDLKGSNVALINEAAAHKLFPGKDPIGRQLWYRDPGEQEHPPFEVIGIVRNAKYGDIDEQDPAIMYVPFSQGGSGATFEIRTKAAPGPLMPAVRAAVRDIDPDLPLTRMETQEDQIRDYIGMYRMFAAFTTIFGSFAVLLACIGLYGIVSYGVTRRINEIGIRMALGAKRADVIHLVMRGMFVVAGLGIAIGVGVALAVNYLISGWLLYGVTPHDPLTILAAAAIIAAVCSFAAYLPARRASRVDPMIALRYE